MYFFYVIWGMQEYVVLCALVQVGGFIRSGTMYSMSVGLVRNVKMCLCVHACVYMTVFVYL